MAQYITVTLDVGGYDEDVLLDLHAQLRDLLQSWRSTLTYCELNLVYQDEEQIDQDAQLHAEPDVWGE